MKSSLHPFPFAVDLKRETSISLSAGMSLRGVFRKFNYSDFSKCMFNIKKAFGSEPVVFPSAQNYVYISICHPLTPLNPCRTPYVILMK